jgi:hypothetical protein
MDTRVRDQVGLELRHIDIESTVKAKGGRERRNDLSNQTIEVGVGRPLNAQVAAADIVESFVVEAERAVRVLEASMRREDRVVGLNDGSRDLGRRRNRKGELGLASIVDRKTLQEKRSETRSGSSARGVKDEESLETRAAVGELTDAIENEVDNLLSNGVMASGVVVGPVLLSTDNLLGMRKLPPS